MKVVLTVLRLQLVTKLLCQGKRTLVSTWWWQRTWRGGRSQSKARRKWRGNNNRRLLCKWMKCSVWRFEWLWAEKVWEVITVCVWRRTGGRDWDWRKVVAVLKQSNSPSTISINSDVYSASRTMAPSETWLKMPAAREWLNTCVASRARIDAGWSVCQLASELT